MIDHRPVRILLADDNPDVQATLRGLLSLQYPDAIIHTADNGQAGLASFTVHRQDIIITDLVMPERDGIQMAREIRLMRPDVKIILLCGLNPFASRWEAMKEGVQMDYYMSKPAQIDVLLPAIARCIMELRTEL